MSVLFSKHFAQAYVQTHQALIRVHVVKASLWTKSMAVSAKVFSNKLSNYHK